MSILSQAKLPKPPSSIPSVPTGQSGLSYTGEILRNAITIMIIIAIILSVIFLIISGIKWITSGGDKEKLQAAKARLTWAIVGLIVAFVAFFLVNILGYIFGVELLGFF